MTDARYFEYQRRISVANDRADIDAVADDLRKEPADDPDVPALGEQLAMVASILESMRRSQPNY